jgi:hypothetical protein
MEWYYSREYFNRRSKIRRKSPWSNSRWGNMVAMYNFTYFISHLNKRRWRTKKQRTRMLRREKNSELKSFSLLSTADFFLLSSTSKQNECSFRELNLYMSHTERKKKRIFLTFFFPIIVLINSKSFLFFFLLIFCQNWIDRCMRNLITYFNSKYNFVDDRRHMQGVPLSVY